MIYYNSAILLCGREAGLGSVEVYSALSSPWGLDWPTTWQVPWPPSTSFPEALLHLHCSQCGGKKLSWVRLWMALQCTVYVLWAVRWPRRACAIVTNFMLVVNLMLGNLHDRQGQVGNKYHLRLFLTYINSYFYSGVFLEMVCPSWPQTLRLNYFYLAGCTWVQYLYLGH